MGRANIISNGITIKPLVESIQHRNEPIVDDVRLYNGTLQRVFRAVKHVISYEHDALTEAELLNWINAHPFNTSYSHTDELDVTRIVVTRSFEYQAVEQPTLTTRTYSVQVEVEEI